MGTKGYRLPDQWPQKPIPVNNEYRTVSGKTMKGDGLNCFPLRPKVGDIYIDSEYKYHFGCYNNVYGWRPRAINRKKAYYREICPAICLHGIVNMDFTFRGCENMVESPAIPSGVIQMRNTFDGCTALSKAPKIPDSVKYLEETFHGCTSLKTPPHIHQTVKRMTGVFSDCTSMQGTLYCDASILVFSDMAMALKGTKIDTVLGMCEDYTRKILLRSKE